MLVIKQQEKCGKNSAEKLDSMNLCDYCKTRISLCVREKLNWK